MSNISPGRFLPHKKTHLHVGKKNAEYTLLTATSCCPSARKNADAENVIVSAENTADNVELGAKKMLQKECPFRCCRCLPQLKTQPYYPFNYSERFLPSEFGVDVGGEGGRAALECVQGMFEEKRRIRQAIEVAGISFSYVCSFCFAEYFARTLRQSEQITSPPTDKVIIYGDGHTKVSFLCEEDIGMFTIKVATDPRALNKVVHLRFPNNILSQLEFVSLWEQKIGKTLEKVNLFEEDILEKVQAHPLTWESMSLAMKHAIFLKGATCNFDESEIVVEASNLYPLDKYISIDEYLGKLVDKS